MLFSEHLSNARGSILAYVIVIVAILSVLGVAIIQVTFSGYLGKLSQYHEKTAQRLAEAGLNEAYAYLLEEVENAIEYSRGTYVPTMLLNNPDVATLTFEARQSRMDEFFVNGYKSYFIVNQNAIVLRLEQALSINRATSYLATGERITRQIATVQVPFEQDTDMMVINFITEVSKTNHQNQTVDSVRTIKADLQIGIPSYNMPQHENTMAIGRNALLDHAMVADGSLFISGGNVVINGNATIGGDDGDFIMRNTDDAGGVIIGGIPKRKNQGSDDLVPIPGFLNRSGNLFIRNGSDTSGGDLNTGKYVRIAFSRESSPSSVTVERDLRCNSLVLQKHVEESDLTTNTDASVKVGRNVLIMDDLEVDSGKAKVEIGGSYFGFSSGSSAASIQHNQSSSIVINNRNFNTDGSSLRINGNEGTEFLFPDGASARRGTYIAGTNYLDDGMTYTIKEPPEHGRVSVQPEGSYTYIKNEAGVVTDRFVVRGTSGELGETQSFELNVDVSLSDTEIIKTGNLASNYQTGDSLSIAGNYISYTRVLSGKDIDIRDDAVNKAPASMIGLDELENFQEIGPHLVVNRLNEVDADGNIIAPSTSEMLPNEKSRYSFFSIGENLDGINLGGQRINLGNVVYALGTFLGFANNPDHYTVGDELTGKITENAGTIASADLVLKNIERDYLHKTLALGDPQHSDYLSNPQSSWLTGGIDTWIKSGVIREGELQEPDIQLGSNDPTNVNAVSRVVPGTTADVFYMQPSENQSVVILKGAGDTSADMAHITAAYSKVVILEAAGNTRGVVIANSDLFIIGSFNFTGLIAAKGNIYCLGDGAKTISNTSTSNPDNYLIQLVGDGIELDDPHHIGFWFRQEDAWNERILVERGNAVSANEFLGSMPSLRDVVTLRNWTVQ